MTLPHRAPSARARLALGCLLGLIALLTSSCLYGIAYGPYRDGQSPDSVQPTSAEIREDLVQLRGVTNRIRTYGSAGALQNIAVEANALGFDVSVGAWLSQDKSANEEELAAAIDLANRGLAQSIIVGNETQLFGTLSESELLGYIRRVKAAVPSTVRVTTAETWSVWIASPQLVSEVDYLLVHIHPFWDGKSIDEAARYVVDKYFEVQAVSNGKLVIIGETGWPSGGAAPSGGVASETNQRRFVDEFTALATQYAIPFYFFSAYDEEWKWSEGLDSNDPRSYQDRTFSGRFVGSSWGILRSDGTIKPQLASLFPFLGPQPPSRQVRTVFDSRGLAFGYDMGVDSSQQKRDWLRQVGDGMMMAYPAGQTWGAVFITVGRPVDPPRPWKDFSSFHMLRVDLRGEKGGESLDIGIKDYADPDNGTESRVHVSSLPTTWLTYQFPLGSFRTADLGRLYVPVEFVFAGSDPQTVYFRNVHFLP